jgi:hypothetical protein
VRWILAQELIRSVGGRLFFTLAVVDVDEIQPRLPGLVGEGNREVSASYCLMAYSKSLLFIALWALAYSDCAVAFLRFLAWRL